MGMCFSQLLLLFLAGLIATVETVRGSSHAKGQFIPPHQSVVNAGGVPQRYDGSQGFFRTNRRSTSVLAMSVFWATTVAVIILIMRCIKVRSSKKSRDEGGHVKRRLAEGDSDPCSVRPTECLWKYAITHVKCESYHLLCCSCLKFS